jgi:hypothetical protein
MPKDMSQISKDIKRTAIPNCISGVSLRQYYNCLENILTSYSNACPATGYMQGMNFIASCLLYNISDGDYSNLQGYEEPAFELFYALMERYRVREFYTQKMDKVFVFLRSLETVLLLNQPALLKHIKTEEVRLSELDIHILRECVLQSGAS